MTGSKPLLSRLANAKARLMLNGYQPAAWEIAQDRDAFNMVVELGRLQAVGPALTLIDLRGGKVRYDGLPVAIVPGAQSYCIGHASGHDPTMTRIREPI